MRCQCKREDRSIRRIDLAVHRRIRKIAREQIRSRVNGGLHFLHSYIDAEIEFELKRDN